MNLKLLFPSYRARYQYVESCLREILGDRKVTGILNLGTGEGDYDRMIKGFCHSLEACDINEEDIEFARRLNADQPGVRYSVQDGQALTYPSERFDVVVCIEVVEHVADPARMIAEITRVLKPGGWAVVTCPSYNYPVLYDPLNRVLRLSGRRLGIGAYAYGHTKLIKEQEIEEWFAEHGLAVVRRSRLSRLLAAMAECYWPGLLQRVFKANASNATARTRRRFVIQPSAAEPAAVRLTDLLIRLDEHLYPDTDQSIGLGYLLRKGNGAARSGTDG